MLQPIVAGHRKYGDPLEAYRRYADAFNIDTRQTSQGDAPVEASLLDDSQWSEQHG